jgi:hypothetical protein
MQYSNLTFVVMLAATATASATNSTLAPYVPVNGTAVAHYPTGTGVSKFTGTAAPTAPTAPTSQMPLAGAASAPTHVTVSVLGLAVAGGVALVGPSACCDRV